jgi:hypothetical protein
MFIQANQSIINLDNVTNIGFLDNRKRIVFNFNCSIESDKNNNIQLVADYRYWNFESTEEYDLESAKLKLLLLAIGNWVEPAVHNHHWVNTYFVTHVNSDDKRNRLIFNLCNSISKDTKLGNNSIVNDFVFWDFNGEREFFEDTRELVIKNLLENN